MVKNQHSPRETMGTQLKIMKEGETKRGVVSLTVANPRLTQVPFECVTSDA